RESKRLDRAIADEHRNGGGKRRVSWPKDERGENKSDQSDSLTHSDTAVLPCDTHYSSLIVRARPHVYALTHVQRNRKRDLANETAEGSGGLESSIVDGQVTQLLRRVGTGDAAASEELLPIVYAELHRVAQRHLRRERPDHTLQATELVNEA